MISTKFHKLNFVKTVLEDLINEQPLEERKKDVARWDMIWHEIQAVENVEMELKKEGAI